ncbi:unnamed protein product, partial [Arabidopsis halleri]
KREAYFEIDVAFFGVPDHLRRRYYCWRLGFTKARKLGVCTPVLYAVNPLEYIFHIDLAWRQGC